MPALEASLCFQSRCENPLEISRSELTPGMQLWSTGTFELLKIHYHSSVSLDRGQGIGESLSQAWKWVVRFLRHHKKSDNEQPMGGMSLTHF